MPNFENIDLLDAGVRSKVIEEIRSEENKEAKRESLKQFEVFRGRQDRFIIEKLQEEFSRKTVNEMRKILSINLAHRIVSEKSSIYNNAPERTFGEVSDNEKEQLENIYFNMDADNKFALANKYFKLQNQVALKVVPMGGKIRMWPLLRHQYDVIPDINNPEVPFAFIINVFDKFDFMSNTDDNVESSKRANLRTRPFANRHNEKIADSDDYRAKLDRYEVWTKDLHFMMDGRGQIMSEDVINPIGMLPFVDIAGPKDFEYFVRQGDSVTAFAIEFGAMLSDLANIARLQGYSQAIVFAEKQPENMVIGPNHILFMQLDPSQPDVTPRFEFANPQPDLQSHLQILEHNLRLFLTDQGLDPKLLSGTADAQRFTSGIERMLAMIDKFEASKEDFELFRKAESDVFDIATAWSNEFQGVTNEDRLVDDLNVTSVNDNATMEIKLEEPGFVQSKSELEDSNIKLINEGLKSKKEAIMELRDVDEDMAEEILRKIEDEKLAGLPALLGPIGGQGIGSTQNSEDEDRADDQSEGSVRSGLQGEEVS